MPVRSLARRHRRRKHEVNQQALHCDCSLHFSSSASAAGAAGWNDIIPPFIGSEVGHSGPSLLHALRPSVLWHAALHRLAMHTCGFPWPQQIECTTALRVHPSSLQYPAHSQYSLSTRGDACPSPVQIEYTTPIGGVSGGGGDPARPPSLNEGPTAALDALASSAQRVRADCGLVLAQMGALAMTRPGLGHCPLARRSWRRCGLVHAQMWAGVLCRVPSAVCAALGCVLRGAQRAGRCMRCVVRFSFRGGWGW